MKKGDLIRLLWELPPSNDVQPMPGDIGILVNVVQQSLAFETDRADIRALIGTWEGLLYGDEFELIGENEEG